ncbi:MAG: pyridoxamine 5'-phosphate oxidase family protein [Chitinispirillaceae bacterium]
MDKDISNLIEKLSRKTGFVLVATADRGGFPHLSVAQDLTLSGDHALIEGWYCPEMLSNLQKNRSVSLIVWNCATDEGYQIRATVTDIEENQILDGYEAAVSEQETPQVRWSLKAQVGLITLFHSRPHLDSEL